MKKIGVLTSGGDAPGMNAAIRAVVRFGIYHNMEVYGIKRGYEGLIDGDVERLYRRSVGDILQRGGTVLKTARSKRFMTPEGMEKAAKTLHTLKIEDLIVIGGNGSLTGAKLLSDRYGIDVMGIPGTIDNDLSYTDNTIGFDTAINTAMDAIDKVKDTSSSHERCSIIEVMGRHAGYIALWCGISTGAEDILIPEKYDYDEQKIVDHIINNRRIGKKHHMIVNAEGIGHSTSMAKRIEAATGVETRATILGYMQRGGSPTCTDRYYASIMGAYAADILVQGKSNRVVAFKNGTFVDYDIEEALAMTKEISEYEYQIAWNLR